MIQEYTFPGLVVDYEYTFINTWVVHISETSLMSLVICTNHSALRCPCNPIFMTQLRYDCHIYSVPTNSVSLLLLACSSFLCNRKLAILCGREYHWMWRVTFIITVSVSTYSNIIQFNFTKWPCTLFVPRYSLDFLFDENFTMMSLTVANPYPYDTTSKGDRWPRFFSMFHNA